VLDMTSAKVKALLADLTREETAKMVRRGLDGIVRTGSSAGGLAYGYRSVLRGSAEKKLKRGGLLERVPEEAETVVEIFRRYAGGESARDIAVDLNRRAVPAPRGSNWNASTIHGEKARGSGILNNELYRGWLVWNKNRMVVHPETGKRVSRRNPPSEWVRIEAPQWRIVDDALWDDVAARKAAVASSRPHQQRKAKRIFSGLLRCGVCGCGMSSKGIDRKTGRVRIQCSGDKEGGVCADPRTYNCDDIEGRVLSLLREGLLDPEAIQVGLSEYTAELARLRRTSSSRRASLEAQLARVSADTTRMNSYLMRGLGDPERTNDLLQPLLAREAELKQELAHLDLPQPASLRPDALSRYVDAVSHLQKTLGNDGQSEAAKLVRQVISEVSLHPDGPSSNRHTPPPRVEVRGPLEALLGGPVVLGGNDGSGGGT
jgi:hypothetical protein